MVWSNSTTSFAYTMTYSWKPAPVVLPVLIGTSYSVFSAYTPLVEKYLMDSTDDIFPFLLKVEERFHDATVPEEDRAALKNMLKTLFIFQATQIYFELAERNLLGSIPYWVWVQFNYNSDWGVTVRTFRDMPTEMFEKFMTSNDYWDRHKTIDVSETLPYIQERTDHWGELPKDLLKELLFTPATSLEGEL